MSVLLYAVTDAALDAAPREGRESRPLRAVRREALRAIVSDVAAPPAAEPQALWAYNDVLTRLMATGALLPARFGTVAPSDGEIAAMLDNREREFAQALGRVGGAVEFAVHAEAGTPVAPAGSEKPGTDYMRGLLAQNARLRELESRARSMVRARRRRSASAFAYLVDRDCGGRFQDLAEALGLALTGPWPPYSFVGGDG